MKPINGLSCNSTYRLRYWNFFVFFRSRWNFWEVATVPTVYGIETFLLFWQGISTLSCNSTYRLRYWNKTYSPSSSSRPVAGLQQYLPFTVLKPIYARFNFLFIVFSLQQYLPFTVLKLLIEVCLDQKNVFFSLQQYLPFTVLKLATL